MSIIAKIFSACLATVNSHADLKRCVQAGAESNQIEWHCSTIPSAIPTGPDSFVPTPIEVCTDAIHEFEKLYREALFNAAKKAMHQ